MPNRNVAAELVKLSWSGWSKMDVIEIQVSCRVLKAQLRRQQTVFASWPFRPHKKTIWGEFSEEVYCSNFGAVLQVSNDSTLPPMFVFKLHGTRRVQNRLKEFITKFCKQFLCKILKTHKTRWWRRSRSWSYAFVSRYFVMLLGRLLCWVEFALHLGNQRNHLGLTAYRPYVLFTRQIGLKTKWIDREKER